MDAETPGGEPRAPTPLTPRRLRRMERVAAARLRGMTLILDNLYQSHNMSAVLRSADAFGIDTVHVVEDRNRFEINRAITHRCEKWMTIRRYDDAAACMRPLRDDGYAIWAALPAADAVTLDRIPLTRRMAFVFGNEGDGIADSTLALCHGTFTIPMVGFSGSLNVSVAAAITLRTASRRYRAWLGQRGDLDPPEVKGLVRAWTRADRPVRRTGRPLPGPEQPPS